MLTTQVEPQDAISVIAETSRYMLALNRSGVLYSEIVPKERILCCAGVLERRREVCCQRAAHFPVNSALSGAGGVGRWNMTRLHG
jgi:hypothetical protein